MLLSYLNWLLNFTTNQLSEPMHRFDSLTYSELFYFLTRKTKSVFRIGSVCALVTYCGGGGRLEQKALSHFCCLTFKVSRLLLQINFDSGGLCDAQNTMSNYKSMAG